MVKPLSCERWPVHFSQEQGRSLSEQGGGKNAEQTEATRTETKPEKEEIIDKRNGCGIKDLTAYNTVLQIKTYSKANIALR